jgi:hypothetical protein
MSDLTTSAHFRLRRTAANRLKESDDTQQSDTVQRMFAAAVQAEAQEICATLLTILQGSATAEEKVQEVIDFVLNISDDEDDDESVDNSPTKVSTKPSTSEPEYRVGRKI